VLLDGGVVHHFNEG